MSAYRGPGHPVGNPGHEAAGTIEKVGKNVVGLHPGQRVGVSAVSGCGTCSFCQAGQYTWCPAYSLFDSMHAEMFPVAANACHLLPDDVSWEVGTLITGDGFGVPFHISTKLQDRPVDTVAIFGAGPIGLGSVILQSYLGHKVIAIDPVDKRLEFAKAFGARHVVNPRQTEDVVAAIKNLTDGLGADVCIEAAGRPDSAKQCFRAVRTAGIVVFNGAQPAVELSPTVDFILRDIWAVGVWYYHFGEFPEMLRLFRSGMPIAKLITHRFPLKQASEAYRSMAQGLTGKVILEY
jgi:threonine dehydrogenase-like Zn-dependent dehydrogenase